MSDWVKVGRAYYNARFVEVARRPDGSRVVRYRVPLGDEVVLDGDAARRLLAILDGRAGAPGGPPGEGGD